MTKEYKHGYVIAMKSVQLLLLTRITELKESSDYPNNFKGQMVEDYEWVIKRIDENIDESVKK